MDDLQPVRQPINRQLTGPALTIGGREIQPVAQISGWQWVGRQPGAENGGVAVRVRPLAFLVREGGATRTVPVVDPESSSLTRLAQLACLVMVGCWLIRLVARRWARHD